ncbi:MAG: adenine deaminase, partial [Firmicutes bacterium]|nr:adenine deaminase [Bacillota bacterium]
LYADPDDAFVAVEALKTCGGGVAFAEGGEVKALLELPVAGLMSDLPLEETAARCAALESAVAEACGLPEFSLPMIIFQTLPVFERYTPTDLGVADGPRKRFVPHIL